MLCGSDQREVRQYNVDNWLNGNFSTEDIELLLALIFDIGFSGDEL